MSTTPFDRPTPRSGEKEGSRPTSSTSIKTLLISHRGNGVNCLKVTPENAIKLYFYEYFRKLFNIDTDKPEVFQRFLIGACCISSWLLSSDSLAGFMAQLAVYPLEIAKTRMTLSSPGVYTGMFDVFKKAVKYEGSLYVSLLFFMAVGVSTKVCWPPCWEWFLMLV